MSEHGSTNRTMRQLHQEYDRRIRCREYLQAWCIAHEGAKRARVEDEQHRWLQRAHLVKGMIVYRGAA